MGQAEVHNDPPPTAKCLLLHICLMRMYAHGVC